MGLDEQVGVESEEIGGKCTVEVLFMHHSNPASKCNFPPSIISIVASYCHMRLERIFYCCVVRHLCFPSL